MAVRRGQEGPEGGVFLCLTNLIADLPVSPQVRAAAFRVLATLPNIRRVDGGRGLMFDLGRHGYATLVVGRTTPALHDAEIVPEMRGPGKHGRQLILSITAGWVNRLPK